MESKFAERTVKDNHEMRYYNQKGELVSKSVGWVFRYERRKARAKGKYQQIQVPHPWTEEELKKIEDEALAEEIQGPERRYWEDVSVGEGLKQMYRDPLA